MNREIRLYPNRRLYDPTLGRYITYEEVYGFLRNRFTPIIRHSNDGHDRTHKVLIDILARQELSDLEGRAPLLTNFALQTSVPPTAVTLAVSDADGAKRLQN